MLLWLLACGRCAASDGGVLSGVCEASGLVWNGEHWLVADNEVSDRLFMFNRSFEPEGTLPLQSLVEDPEALAVEGAKVWVFGSASRKKNGEEVPERRRILQVGAELLPLDWSRCRDCGTVNVEGAAFWKGALWMGFRSPVPEGKTRLWNTQTGEMLERDWGGFGIRDMAVRGEELWLILGPSEKETRPFMLGTVEKGPLSALPEGAEGLGVGPLGELVVVTDGGWNQQKNGCKTPSTWQVVIGH